MIILLLHYLINIYLWIVIIASLLTWIKIDPQNPIVRFLFQITQPLFDWLKARLPLQYQGVDFAPLVVVIVLSLLDRLLIGGF